MKSYERHFLSELQHKLRSLFFFFFITAESCLASLIQDAWEMTQLSTVQCNFQPDSSYSRLLINDIYHFSSFYFIKLIKRSEMTRPFVTDVAKRKPDKQALSSSTMAVLAMALSALPIALISAVCLMFTHVTAPAGAASNLAAVSAGGCKGSSGTKRKVCNFEALCSTRLEEPPPPLRLQLLTSEKRQRELDSV